MINLYSNFIKPGDLVFDIGANIGNITDIFLKLGALVVAVEPQDYPMEKMRKKYRNNKRVILVHRGLDSKIGEQEMLICNAHLISTMSKDLVSAIKRSGRFGSSIKFIKTKKVSTTTLDMLIKEYGKPTFCKIDVEGYEPNVLRGLSSPIPYISFEFIPEYLNSAKDCINYLSTMGNVVFNYSFGSMRLALSNWISAEEMIKILEKLSDKNPIGDVYARFTD